MRQSWGSCEVDLQSVSYGWRDPQVACDSRKSKLCRLNRPQEVVLFDLGSERIVLLKFMNLLPISECFGHSFLRPDIFLFSRWLIEVNASPSLTASSQSDYELKVRFLEDLLSILDMENRYDPKMEARLEWANIIPRWTQDSPDSNVSPFQINWASRQSVDTAEIRFSSVWLRYCTNCRIQRAVFHSSSGFTFDKLITEPWYLLIS